MIHTESIGAASFFEYRESVAEDFRQFYLTITKPINKAIVRLKSDSTDVISFSGFNCLSDEEPTKMGVAQMVKAQFVSIQRYLVLTYKRHAELRALRDLSRLSDSTLDDIGLTRADINYVKTLPLSSSPVAELNKINGQMHQRLV